MWSWENQMFLDDENSYILKKLFKLNLIFNFYAFKEKKQKVYAKIYALGEKVQCAVIT